MTFYSRGLGAISDAVGLFPQTPPPQPPPPQPSAGPADLDGPTTPEHAASTQLRAAAHQLSASDENLQALRDRIVADTAARRRYLGTIHSTAAALGPPAARNPAARAAQLSGLTNQLGAANTLLTRHRHASTGWSQHLTPHHGHHHHRHRSHHHRHHGQHPAERSVGGDLPPGVGSERGLQRFTILAKRAVSAAFPEISDIGGVRPDSLKWHPNGLAIDVMIPNPYSAHGKALGEEVMRFAMRHKELFRINHVIWHQTIHNPDGSASLMENRGSPTANHMDHVHIATNGGGYPNGQERYRL